MLNRIIGDTWNLVIPLDKVGLKHGNKVKIFITKEENRMGEFIDKSALVQYLTGMAESACCDKNVKRIIKEFIIPHINTLEVKKVVDAEIVEVEDNNYSIYAYTHLEICTDEDLSKICKAGDKAEVIILKQK